MILRYKLLFAMMPLVLLLALPVAMRPKRDAAAARAEEFLVVITPHNEATRHEFKRAFKEYYYRETGKTIGIEWRLPGGTSDIVRYINDRFLGNFRRHWEADRSLGPWSRTVADNFNNHRLDSPPQDADPLAMKAREVFLASNVGVGVDLFFGGGQYDIHRQAQKGHAVDAGLLQSRPELFVESVIPQTFSGEIFYDPHGRYYGTCLSSFGICYNLDLVDLLAGGAAPRRWEDLARPEFRGGVAVADPTKSGSINKCFEMLIQQQMAMAIRRAGGNASAAALEKGWTDGMQLIKLIGANSRYITDSASKVPRDVGLGEAAAGMCIDFYGRSEAEWTAERSGGRERMAYTTPLGGSSVSADPIMMFRGAPNPAAARMFIEFVLSKEGQRLWNYRPGTPGGPAKYALRRLPVRKDMYTPQDRRFMSDADAEPFNPEEEFIYDPKLTGRYFSLIRVLVKTMVIDSLPELQAAWTAINAAGGPSANPAAMAELRRLPFAYAGAAEAAASLNPNAPGNSPLSVVERQRQWSEFFRARYSRAAQLAGGTL